MKFVKMHGLGNDFIILFDDTTSKSLSKDFICDISNRKTGIGCDQLVILKSFDRTNHLIKIFNADGTTVSACGNATRCAAYLMYMQNNAKKHSVEIVHGRKMNCEVLDENNVIVDMGEALLLGHKYPEITELCSRCNLQYDAIEIVNIGNQHLVLFGLSDQEMDILGGLIQNSDLFPSGINVNFATIIDRHNISLKVLERGVGYTMACGSGACATFAVAKKLSYVDNEVDVYFEMGKLTISSIEDRILMSGPVAFVYDGTFFGTFMPKQTYLTDL